MCLGVLERVLHACVHMMADLQGMWPPVTSLPADFQMEEREKSWRMELMCSQQSECLVLCREKGEREGWRKGEGEREKGDRGRPGILDLLEQF